MDKFYRIYHSINIPDNYVDLYIAEAENSQSVMVLAEMATRDASKIKYLQDHNPHAYEDLMARLSEIANNLEGRA